MRDVMRERRRISCTSDERSVSLGAPRCEGTTGSGSFPTICTGEERSLLARERGKTACTSKTAIRAGNYDTMP